MGLEVSSTAQPMRRSSASQRRSAAQDPNQRDVASITPRRASSFQRGHSVVERKLRSRCVLAAADARRELVPELCDGDALCGTCMIVIQICQ
jgi:hypothetical protein